MRYQTASILFVLCSLSVLHAEPATQPSPDALDADLESHYQSLDANDKRFVDRMTVAKKKDVLRQMIAAKKKRDDFLQDRSAPQPPTTQIISAREPGLDLLAQAFAKYNDKGVPRDAAILLFEQYLRENPNGVFAAEVNFRIAALYSIHARVGESRERSLQQKYLVESHRLYGRKLSYINLTVWATLANLSDSIKVKREHYDWLRGFRTDSPPDGVDPVREVEQVLGRNVGASRSNQEQVELLRFFKAANLDIHLQAAEDNLLAWAGKRPNALEELANAYAGTSLGEKARQLSPLKQNADGPVASAPSTDASSRKNESSVSTDATTTSAPSQGGLWKTIAIGTVCCAVVLLVIAAVRRFQKGR